MSKRISCRGFLRSSAAVSTAMAMALASHSLDLMHYITGVTFPRSFEDRLRCVRSRGTPHAPPDAGYQHAVAAPMAVRAMDTGRRIIIDPAKREIREG